MSVQLGHSLTNHFPLECARLAKSVRQAKGTSRRRFGHARSLGEMAISAARIFHTELAACRLSSGPLGSQLASSTKE